MPLGPSRVDEFESLLNPVLETAYRVALRYCGNAELASDLVQESVVSALSGFDSFTPGTNFRAWFLRILTNAYLQSRRKSAGRETLDIDEAPDLFLYLQTKRAGLHEASADPARELADKLAAEQVAAAIDSLPDDYRTTLALYLMNEMSYDEIAQVQGIPLGTVRSRIHRGRNILQRELWPILQGVEA